MYLAKYIERMGTGIRDMIGRCYDAGLPEPEIRIDGGFWVLTIPRKKPDSGAQSGAQSRAQSGAQSEAILLALGKEPLSAAELSVILGLQSKTGAFKRTLQELVENGMVEFTIPDKPNSRLQQYRLTGQGHALLAELEKPGDKP
jgi:predicted HTH transcriptional regulator